MTASEGPPHVEYVFMAGIALPAAMGLVQHPCYKGRSPQRL